MLFGGFYWTVLKGQSIKHEQQSQNTRGDELPICRLELDTFGVSHEINEKHAAYESYGTENPYRREILDCIESVGFQNIICN